MFCPNCGTQLQENAKFCSKCQTKLDNKKHINKKLVTLIVLGILIIILSVILIFYKKYKDSFGGEDISSKNVVTYNYADNGIPKFIDGSFSNEKVKNIDNVYKALNDIKDVMKFTDASKEFSLTSQETHEGITYYNLQQVYKDVPLLYQNIIVSIDKDGNILSLSGYYTPNVDVNTVPKISSNELEDTLKKNYNDVKIESRELYILTNNGDYNLVYDILGDFNNEAKEIIIDANNGEIYVEDNLMLYDSNYSFNGIGIDDIKYTINLEEYHDFLLDKNRYRFYDSIRKISIADYRNIGYVVGALVSVIPGTTPYSIDIIDNIVSVDEKDEEFVKNAITTMANFEKIYDYYKRVLNRDSYNDKGSKIIVNLGITSSTFSSKDYDNAAWMKYVNQMFIGNKNGKSYSASLDVLGHEFTHGVVNNVTHFACVAKDEDKNKAFETGALNEAYADIIGSLIEGKNWTIAENNEIVRDAEDPEKYKCASEKGGEYYWPNGYINKGTLESLLEINNLKSVVDYDKGGVHQNATIVTHAAYLMEKNGAFKDKEEMAKVWYNSLFLLSSYANFEDCALAVIKTAQNFNLSEGAIYTITQAFIDTKILDKESYTIKGIVTNGNKSIKQAEVSIYTYNDNSLITSKKTNKDGEFEFELQPGTYKIKITKKDYEEYKDVIIVKGDIKYDVKLAYINKEENNDVLSKKCNANKCYNVKIYFLGPNTQNKLDEQYEVYAVPAGTTFNSDILLQTLNGTFGNDFIKFDGESFYITVGGFSTEFAWYYRDTDTKFNWNEPINEDIELEMKLFNGFLDNDFLQSIYDFMN